MEGVEMRDRLRLRGPWPSVSLLLLVLLGAQTYFAYRFPIKQDHFGHPFREHLSDRLVAYGYLLRSSHKLSPLGAAEIDDLIEETAAEYGADPSLVKAIAVYESHYLPHAISTTGAMGLMALMPTTAQAQGVRDPFDPRQNVAGGVRLLMKLSEAFGGDTASMLAAYNAGAERVRQHGGVPPFAETTAYVSNVMSLRDFFERERLGMPSPGLVAH